MPAKYTLHVVLTETLVRYVRDKVAAGHHPTISDVVRQSIQALMDRDGEVTRKADAGRKPNRIPHG